MGDGQVSSRARLKVAGHVQGVGFRYSTVLEAEARRVRGWVRNLPDGRVEVVAEGPRSAVDGLIAWCHKGPRHAQVYDVDVVWETPGHEPLGFRAA